MTFDVKGETYFFKGSLTVVSADNPASQLLGGFKQGHTAYRKCRHCLALDSDIQTKVRALYVIEH